MRARIATRAGRLIAPEPEIRERVAIGITREFSRQIDRAGTGRTDKDTIFPRVIRSFSTIEFDPCDRSLIIFTYFSLCRDDFLRDRIGLLDFFP